MGKIGLVLCTSCAFWSPLLISAQEKKDETLVIKIKGNNTSSLNYPTSTASRLPVEWIDSPASTSVYDQNFIEKNAPDRIEDIVNYSAGLQEGVDSAGLNTAIFARGYDSAGSLFYNQHQGIQRFYSQDFSTIGKVEILKGHDSVLYGEGTPGATINYISKRPQAHPQRKITSTIGNFNLRRITGDFTGALNKDKSLQYRFIGTLQDADTFRENVENDRYTLFSSFLWKYKEDSILRLELENNVNKLPYNFGTVYAKGQVLYNQSYVDPRASSNRWYQRSALYLDHYLSENWKAHATLNYVEAERADVLFGFFYKLDEDSLLGYYRDIQDDYEQKNFRLELQGDFDRHDFTFGLERNESDADRDSQRSFDFTLDTFNPVFPENLPETSALNDHILQENSHLYFLDRFTINDKILLSFGARYTDYKVDTDYGKGFKTSTDKSVLAKSFGFIYKLKKEFSLYSSYSESYQPNLGRDRNNNFFAPKEAAQWEVGFKLRANNIDYQVALYDLTQKNLTTRDPVDRDFFVLDGERKTQGLEIEVAGTLTDDLDFKVAYAYIDAKYTKHNDGLEGNTPSSIPNHHGGLWLNWKPLEDKNFSLSSGVIGTTSRWGDNSNTFKVSGYSRLDLGAEYKNKNMIFRLNVQNALDTDYVSAIFGKSNVYQGNKRTIKASFTYQW